MYLNIKYLVKTNNINRIIIDEADTLLSAEFATELKQIIKSSGLSAELQVLATSATITTQLQRTMTVLFPDVRLQGESFFFIIY